MRAFIATAVGLLALVSKVNAGINLFPGASCPSVNSIAWDSNMASGIHFKLTQSDWVLGLVDTVSSFFGSTGKSCVDNGNTIF